MKKWHLRCQQYFQCRRNFEDRSYARGFGIVLNHRNVENEKEKVQAFSEKIGCRLWEKCRQSNEKLFTGRGSKNCDRKNPASEIRQMFIGSCQISLWKEEGKRMRQEAYFCTVKELMSLEKITFPDSLFPIHI